MRKKIAIYGNGKFAKALVRGLRSEYEILVIASRETSDLSFFEMCEIPTSTNVHDILHADCLVLAVTPQGVGPMFKKLNTVQLIPELIISFVSGLTRNIIGNELSAPLARVVTGTANTCIAFSYGRIVLCGEEGSFLRSAFELFRTLGPIESESQGKILKSVVTYGSDNGFNAKALRLCYEQYQGTWSLYQWISELRNFLLGHTIYKYVYEKIGTHLTVKEQVFREVFTYSKKKAKQRVFDSFMSMLLGLLVTYGENITVDHIDDLIASVVTPGGCTEEGIKQYHYDVLDAFPVISSIYHKVWERALKFPSDVRESCV